MPFITFYDCSNCDNFENNCSSNESNPYLPKLPIQCTSCPENYVQDPRKIYIQKQIQNTVRVPASLYKADLAALTVKGQQISGPNSNKPLPKYYNVNESQASDRNRLHFQQSIPNPKLRPGKLAPGGTGVDVKHNSFARVLARRKAQNLITTPQTTPPLNLFRGNKVQKFAIVNSNQCQCP
tara:strand:- start:289 stop:831 length:543 start_codon:yes stop_codon:yes gene_type:complete